MPTLSSYFQALARRVQQLDTDSITISNLEALIYHTKEGLAALESRRSGKKMADEFSEHQSWLVATMTEEETHPWIALPERIPFRGWQATHVRTSSPKAPVQPGIIYVKAEYNNTADSTVIVEVLDTVNKLFTDAGHKAIGNDPGLAATIDRLISSAQETLARHAFPQVTS